MNAEILNKIIEILPNIFTLQNISFGLGLFGSVGTAWNLISSRKRLRIQIADSAYRTDRKTLVIVVTFENRSRLPISITDATLIAGEKEFSFEPYPRCVAEYFHKKGSEVVDKQFLYNLSFPVSLSQLGAASGYLLLDISQEDFEKLPTRLILKVHSSRGLAQKRLLNTEEIKLTTLSDIQHPL